MILQEKTDIRIANLFASPLAARMLKDADVMNQKLVSSILAHAQASGGESKTNVGGWHSETGQLEYCGEAGLELIRHIYTMTDEVTRQVLADNNQPWRPMRWTLHAWANVNRTGDFNRVHTHAGSTWSGTYYVDAGDPDGDQGAPIHLLDPCQGRANTFLPGLVATTFLQRPQAGLMILFPSYVPHMVYAHHGRRPRISVAFNMRKEPYP